MLYRNIILSYILRNEVAFYLTQCDFLSNKVAEGYPSARELVWIRQAPSFYDISPLEQKQRAEVEQMWSNRDAELDLFGCPFG